MIENLSQRVQLTFHVRTIALDPALDLQQWLRAQAVVAEAAVLALLDQPRTLEHAQLLAYRGLRELELVHEGRNMPFAGGKKIQHGTPCGTGYRLENRCIALWS